MTARIASASVSTGIGALDDHLRGPDMLDAASYPELAFESRTVNAAGDHYRIEGDLRIWDETRPIVVEARIADQAASEPVQPGEPAASGERVSFHGTTRLRGLFADETLDLTIQLTAVQENGAGTRRESAAS